VTVPLLLAHSRTLVAFSSPADALRPPRAGRGAPARLGLAQATDGCACIRHRSERSVVIWRRLAQPWPAGPWATPGSMASSARWPRPLPGNSSATAAGPLTPSSGPAAWDALAGDGARPPMQGSHGSVAAGTLMSARRL